MRSISLATFPFRRSALGSTLRRSMTQEPEALALKRIGNTEAFLMGGCSILLYILFTLFVHKDAVPVVSTVAFSLAFLVNYPHFMASYYILYKENRHKLSSSVRYLWVSTIVPLVLLTLLVTAHLQSSTYLLGLAINIMFFTVGWHYVKQIFGCLVVSNIFKNFFYNAFERNIVLTNLYILWAIAWVPANLYGTTFTFYGLSYTGLNITNYLHHALLLVGIQTVPLMLGKLITFTLMAALLVTLSYIIYFHVIRYLQTKTFPHVAGILAFVSIYLWYVPLFSHPAYFYVIPFLHSLQYLALVRVYATNKHISEARDVGLPDEVNERATLSLLRFSLFTIVSGALLFWFVPHYLDMHKTTPLFSAPTFLISFILFINIHHYFIDNIIWKKDNELVRKYLFGR
ncbi:MAG: hypothetical protein RIQ41_66 [Candidatus Parcubacteria bacterium]|jgi:hypothetical protein